MSNWAIRYEGPAYGTPPYDWNSASRYQCTWYAYWRVQEGSGLAQPPCWYRGSGSSGYGLYTNAKEWLNHYRDPWEVKGLNYDPQAGDIIVFDGIAGHVVVVEKNNGDGTLYITDYNGLGGSERWGYKTNYVYGNRLPGTGNCIGALHNPNISPEPPGPGPERSFPIWLLVNKRRKKVRVI